MATLSNLSTSTLALKGAGTEYNYLQRFFATKAEADAALADGSWVPTAGTTNGCLTGDQGLLVYNEGTSSLDVADAATRAYIDSTISSLVDGAPGTLDTLNELAAALNDNPNYFTDAEAARNANTALINSEAARALAAETALQADVDQNEADADAAIAAVQADVDQNEADADAAIAALQADVDQNEADADAAIVALQADVDQNEADADAAIAALQADVDQNESDADAAIAAVQADVDQNESDADAAIAAEEARALAAEAAIQADVDQNESDADAAIAAVQADVDQNEADADAAIAAVQADVDQNEADADAAIAALQADVDQNEADADAAIAAVQADVDQNEADADAAIAAVQADVDQNEQDADNAIAAETARALAAEQVIQNDVDQNEADADAAIAAEEARALAAEALLAPLASPALTGVPTAPTANQAAGTTQIATTAYVDTAVANLIDTAPGALDTLNELAAAIGDDANFSTTITNSITAVQNDVNQNEVDSDAADAALSARLDVLEADPTTATAVAAVQADVDQNEADADAAIAAVQADVDQNEADADAAIAAVQADVDQNEADADAAIAAVQADVDQNEADADAADVALGGRIDDVELEIDTARTNLYTAIGRAEGATTMGTFTGSTLADNTTVKALLQTLETATEDEITARTAIAEFASNLTKIKNDLRGTYINVGNNIEIRPAPGGRVEIVGDLYLDNNTAIDGAGTTLTSFANINAYDGRLNTLEADPTTATAVAAVQADVDQNEADADAAIAAVQADVDQNESDADAAIAAVQADVDQNEADADAAIAAVQADVDQNESDSDAADAAIVDGTTNFTGFQLQGTAVTATGAELNYVDVTSPGTADASKALIVDGTKSISGINTLTVQNLNVQGTTTTVDTVTMQAANAIQFEGLTADANETILSIIDPTADRTVYLPNQSGYVPVLAAASTTQITATPEELNYVDGVTSNVQTQLDAIQSDVDQNEADADAAIAAVQADVDQNEADADAAIAAVQADVDQNEADADAAIAAVQADVDQNEADADAAIAAVQADVDQNEADADAAIAALQADVDQNESDADAAIAAVQADVDQNEADSDAAEAALSARIDTLEADPTTATAVAAVQADVDQNESDADAAIAAVQADVDQNEADSDAADAAIVDGTTNFTGFQLQGTSVTATGAELNYVDVAAAGSAEASKAMVLDAGKSISGVNQLTCIDLVVQGTTTTVDTVTMQATNAISFEGATADSNETTLTIIDPDADRTIKLPNQSGCLPVLAADSNTAITATPEELNQLDGVTLGTAAASATGDFATAAQGALADSALQAADITGKADAADSTLTGVTSMEDLDIDSGKITYDTGTNLLVTSGITTTTSAGGTGILTVGGAASLTAGCSVSGSHLNVAAGLQIGGVDVTATAAELNYTDGVTSNIQTQLDAIQSDVDQNESDADAAIAAVLAGTSIPGPYNNDSAAGDDGVAVGAIYKNSNGTIHWRVS